MSERDHRITATTRWRGRVVHRKTITMTRRQFYTLLIIGAIGVVMAFAGFALKLVWFFLSWRAGCAR